jgi:integrase/recombinase XerD
MSRPQTIIIVSEDYKKLSNDFYRYQIQLGYIKETCRTRQLYLNEFLSWLEQNGISTIDEIQAHQIQSYYQYISHRPSKQKEGNLSEKYIITIMKSISQFYTMLQSKGETETNPVNSIKLDYPRNESTRETLSQEEINQLYQACESIEERAILSLGYGCGLRSGEMENLDVEEVKLRSSILIVSKGKGNKRRVIPMSKGVKEDLSKYHKYRRKVRVRTKSFMLNSRDRRMREYTYNKHLKSLLEKAGIKKTTCAEHSRSITIHNLRHSIASHLIEQGIPVEQVRDFLGHSQLETTQIYTHISKSQLRKLIDET